MEALFSEREMDLSQVEARREDEVGRMEISISAVKSRPAECPTAALGIEHSAVEARLEEVTDNQIARLFRQTHFFCLNDIFLCIIQPKFLIKWRDLSYLPLAVRLALAPPNHSRHFLLLKLDEMKE